MLLYKLLYSAFNEIRRNIGLDKNDKHRIVFSFEKCKTVAIGNYKYL